jgi:hypothetical protein
VSEEIEQLKPGLDKTRLLFRLGVCMDALGWSPGELNDLNEAEFEQAVTNRARELRKLEERSQSDIVLGRPLKIKLHLSRTDEPQEFEVRPLTMEEDAKWREQANSLREKGRKRLMEIGQKPANEMEVILISAREFPQDVIEMFWAYCPVLAAQRKQIESASSSIEIMQAAAEVMRFTSPFFSLLDRLGAAAMEALLPTD